MELVVTPAGQVRFVYDEALDRFVRRDEWGQRLN